MMEDKRGTKCSCSPSNEGSPSPSDIKTPPPASSESPPSPGSSSKISLRRPCSLVSLDEEDHIINTSHDFEFAQRLYDELNHTVLGPPGDGNIIILSDYNEEEVREEKTIGTENAVAFAVVNHASTASADTDDAPAGVKNDNNDD
jgi:hypothetical protein